ncbi:uracil-DNA glycosylase [soil metagenome]
MQREILPPPGFPAEIPVAANLVGLHAVMSGCTRCDLFLGRTQVVPGHGNPEAQLFFVGEAPGATEDQQGVPFVGASGRLLDSMLLGAGIRREDVFIGNIVRCRPPENRNPRTRQIAACAGWLAEQLRLVNPRLVVPLGRFALHHFLPAGKITQVQASLREIPYHGGTIRIFPLVHPAAVLRNPRLRPLYQDQFRSLAGLISEG